jgi:hypothetical protein
MNATHIIAVRIPIRVVSLSNLRECWQAKQRRAKTHRAAVKLALGRDIKGPPPPYVITLTRIGPRVLDPGNLEASFKHIQDGVADWLGIDDGDKRLTWRYEQRREGAKTYAAEVVIAAALEPGEPA